jgi:hypothetical protein
LAVVVAALYGFPAAAATIHITNPTFNALGHSIEYSAPGDTILVGPGTYPTSNVILSTPRVILSTTGPWETVIDLSSVPGATISISDGTDETILRGLTVTGASFSGVVISGSSPTLENNIFVACRSSANSAGETGPGGAIAVQSGSPIIRQNTIVGNTSSGGAIELRFATARIERNVIAYSRGDFRNYNLAFGISCFDDFGSTVERNVFWSNPSATWSSACSGLAGLETNVTVDPLFCDPTDYGWYTPGGDWRVMSGSPIAPGGEHYGAGAEVRLCGGVPTRAATWGDLKARYR